MITGVNLDSAVVVLLVYIFASKQSVGKGGSENTLVDSIVASHLNVTFLSRTLADAFAYSGPERATDKKDRATNKKDIRFVQ